MSLSISELIITGILTLLSFIKTILVLIGVFIVITISSGVIIFILYSILLLIIICITAIRYLIKKPNMSYVEYIDEFSKNITKKGYKNDN